MEKVLILFCGILALSQGRVFNPLSSRIVNGEKVNPGEIPYQVSLQYGSTHFCGGSILNEHYVITAAHCVSGKTVFGLYIVAGTLLYKEPSQKLAVEHVTVHETYDPSNYFKDDIALIKVRGSFSFNELVKPVTLPNKDQSTQTGTPAVVSGWGVTKFGNFAGSDNLLKAEIYITDQDYCVRVMKEVYSSIFDTQICATDLKERRGACSGDSGGPLTVNDQLVGIVSWTIVDGDCGSTKYPTVYTRVAKYIDWINEHAF